MKNKKEVNFTMEQLADFLKRYPVHGLKDSNYVMQDETDVYLVAFKYYVEHGEDIMADYYRIKDTAFTAYNMDVYREYYSHGYQSFDILRNIISDLKFVINYDVTWNADLILNTVGFSRENLKKCLYEIENDFPKHAEENKLNKKKEHENYIEKYYETERTLTKEDLDIFFNKTIMEEMSSNIDKNIVDVTNIKYPLLVFFYKDNKIISINKVVKGLEASLVNHKKSKDFDSYTYIYINEGIIDDILSEAFIRINPSNMISNAITIKNSIYRTLKQIKQRYKDKTSLYLKDLFCEFPINNGEFKGAMDKCGFKYDPNDGTNWYFNISKKFPILLVK
ncbi:hypothetical protein G9F72_021255 [Clostridium estertheticum]|uniref:hypothetical protein n=1 Tax=Clostridium estertheticum TaxID=238834 RepID=UPI001CD0526F|nr:hypothetical protein [Clostridium estertheticum]MBZ9688853.1 hypothetical protein [Clostridium estertheticum]